MTPSWTHQEHLTSLLFPFNYHLIQPVALEMCREIKGKNGAFGGMKVIG
jgi:hypothetical protein